MIALCYSAETPAFLTRPFAVLGAISYPLYAIHYPMIQPLKLIGEKLHLPPSVAMPVIAIITCIAAYVLAVTDESVRKMLKRRSQAVSAAG